MDDFYYDADMAASSRPRAGLAEKLATLDPETLLPAGYSGERCIIGDKCFCSIGLRCSNWRRPTAEG